MKFLWLSFCTAAVLLAAPGDGREYHYDKPSVPFQQNAVHPQQPQQQQQQHQHLSAAQSGVHFVVGGGQGPRYDIQAVRAPQVYAGYQPARAPGAPPAALRGENLLSQPIGAAATTPNVNPFYPGLHAAQQQQQQQQQLQHHAQASNVQFQQQHQQQFNGVAGGSIDIPHAFAGAGAPGVGGHFAGAQASAVGAGAFGGAAIGGGFGGAPSVGGGFVGAPGGHPGGAPGGHPGGAPGGGFGGGGFVGAPGVGGGFGAAPGGHPGGAPGSGVGGFAGAASNNQVQSSNAAELFRLSNGASFVSQSETAELDHYPHKQLNPGDTRAFQRHITVCYGNGQCQQTSLAPGELDPTQFPIVIAARNTLAPISDKCRRIAEVSNDFTGYPYPYPSAHKPAFEFEETPLKEQTNGTRPPSRRLFVDLNEVQIKQDPYN